MSNKKYKRNFDEISCNKLFKTFDDIHQLSAARYDVSLKFSRTYWWVYFCVLDSWISHKKSQVNPRAGYEGPKGG